MKVVTDSIQLLAQVLTSCTPGLKAIESAIGNIADVVSILNQAVVESTLNQLDPRSGMLSNSLIDSIKAATSLLDLVAKHSNSDTSQMILSLVDLPNCINQVSQIQNFVLLTGFLIDCRSQYINCFTIS